ncbi:hypothetical protein [Burkholderia vietnamiensis]|uniref:hypothetical protein n=1 Tax=Burkholderia vietnamiensis TaxID=60552 RepID=UPI0015940A81|nr:hypothetical protein [Burkholderia vietnamiensis]
MSDYAGVGGTISGNVVKKEAFVLSMLIASLIGFALIPALTPFWWKTGAQQSAYVAVTYVTSMHIGLTYFFYLDRDAQTLIRSQWFRFYVAAPATLAFFFLAFYLGSEPVRNTLWVFIGGWTIWHFQKQNFGIFNLVNLARSSGPMKREEKFAIYAAGIAGVLFNSIGYAKGLTSLGYAAWSTPALVAGYAFQAVAVGVAALVMYRDRSDLALRHAFLVIFVLNWLPLAFLPWQVAFFACAYGHGIQYALMMGIVGSNSSRIALFRNLSPRITPYVGVTTVALIGVGMFWFAGHTGMLFGNGSETTPLGAGLIGLTFAVTGVHYVLDAGIWRMRLPLPRQYMQQKLNFLFSK